MGTLKPEKRMNAKGHMVTKWVKDDAGTPSSLLVLGNDSGQKAKATLSRVSKRLENLIASQIMTVPSEIEFKDIAAKLSGLSASTLEMISDVQTASEDDHYLDCIIISALHYGKSEYLDDLVHVYTEIDPEIGGDITQYSEWDANGFSGHSLIRFALVGAEERPVSGLEYSVSSEVPLRLREDDTSSKLLAVYSVMNLLEEEFTTDQEVQYGGGGGAWLRDPEFAAYVVEHHEDIGSIIDIMRERETFDLDTIKAVMSASSPALREGAL
jgi:hypothetical protein